MYAAFKSFVKIHCSSKIFMRTNFRMHNVKFFKKFRTPYKNLKNFHASSTSNVTDFDYILSIQLAINCQRKQFEE